MVSVCTVTFGYIRHSLQRFCFSSNVSPAGKQPNLKTATENIELLRFVVRLLRPMYSLALSVSVFIGVP